MASPQLCTINSCKRISRALCNCCQQYLCIDHLKGHSDLLNAQLTPFADQINALFEQLNNTPLISPIFLAELDKWSQEAHRIIDRFCEKKRREFEQFVHNEHNKQKTELDRLRNQVDQLIRDQEATREHIHFINDSIRFLQQQLQHFQLPQFTLSSLIIDDSLVDIKQTTSSLSNLLPLPAPYRTIKIKDLEYSIAANENHLLVVGDSKLCLLDRQLLVQKEIPWSHGRLFDIFWSKPLTHFILVTEKQIFTLDEQTMTLQRCPMIRNSNGIDWYCGTYSNDTLFLSTGVQGSSIYSYTLRPSIEFVKEYRSPLSCTANEFIWDLSSNNVVLALVIINGQCEMHFDLRSPNTLERLRSIQLGSMSTWFRIRCCSVNNDQWLLTDPNNAALLHISVDGKLVKQINYNTSAWHAVQLGNDSLAILTKTDVNLHPMPS